MEPPAEAATDPPQSTQRNASFFCLVCQNLFTEGKKGYKFYHYATWTELIESAALGCILCSQMMSALLEDRQEELLPRLKEDAEFNNADIYCRLDQSYLNVWSLEIWGEASCLNGPPALFKVHETSKFRKQYTVPSLMGNPIDITTQRTDNEKTWQNISRWLSDCSCNHETCNSSSDEALWMPSRVIDVVAGQSSDVKEDRIFMISTKDISPLCEYATLSHCWGGQVPVQLNKETRNQLISGYSVDSLPRTFADAVRITRRLGIRYVWIDSLCIEQDSEEDWRKESQTMDQVYSHSWCNIVASASKDSSGGCFFNWNTKFSQPFEADVSWTADSDGQGALAPHIFLRERMWWTYVYEDVLDQRAWVMQERILPVRQLSFTRAGVFWECRCLLANPYLPENLVTGEQRRFYKSFSMHLERLAKRPPRRSIYDVDQEIRAYKSWNSILEVYSEARLTKATDRLVAISGLAKKMQKALDDEYLAGLWKSRFLVQLCWMVEEESEAASRRPRPLLAPTWSWASTLQPIKMFGKASRKPVPVSEVLEVNLQHLSDDSTGEVVGGYLRLRAVLGSVHLSQRLSTNEKFFDFQAWMMTASGVFDEGYNKQEICGNIFYTPIFYDSPTAYVHGILLQSICEEKGEYERIGYWEFRIADDGQKEGESSADKKTQMAKSWVNGLRNQLVKKKAGVYQDITIY